MEKEKYTRNRVASIRVEPYLAVYAREKFEIDPKTGGIKIPDSFDLYHCVWQLMERRPRNAELPEDPNLKIWLPSRRCTEGLAQKNPAFWNYLSPRSQRLVEKSLRRLFNWEFHYFCEDLVSQQVTKKEAVDRFISMYNLGIDVEDTLLKNLQRHERTIQVFLGIKKRKNKKKHQF